MRLRLAVLGAVLAVPALAQQPAPDFAPPNLTPRGVAAMATDCAMCHGQRGVPVAGSNMARLAGRPAQDVIQAMKDFRDARRPATIMQQIARGFSDAEVAALAAYFAAQKEAP